MAQTKIKASQFSGVIGNGVNGYVLQSSGDGDMEWVASITPPTITSLSYPGSATAADPAGGQTVTITGTGFASGATVTVGGTAAPAVSFVSATTLTITTPAKAAGDYDVVVTNTDTGSATFINGISYNGIPAWTTAAGSLGTFASAETISTITLAATEPDGGTITFNITNGALPTGLSLTGANIDGTTSLETAETLYTFTVTATDNENQTTPRVFTITVQKQFIGTENFTINTYTGNGSTQSIEGKIGTAAVFNGSSSHIDIGDVIPNTDTDYSVSTWINIDSGFTSGNRTILGAASSSSGTEGSFRLQLTYVSANTYKITIARTVATSGTNFYYSSSWTASSINTGQWYHIVATYNSTGRVGKTYLNGAAVDSSALTSSASVSSVNNDLIGGQRTNAAKWLGKIDQFRIFNKVLSSSEVTTLYGESNTSTTKSTTDIFNDGSGIALYEFEEGAKDTGGVTGYIGSGGIFNGSSSYIDLGNNSSNNGSLISVSCWFRTSSTSAGLIWNNGGQDSQSTGLSLSVQGSGVLYFQANTGTTFVNDTGTTTVNDGNWHHVVANYDNGDFNVYLDGNSTPELTGTSTAFTTTANQNFLIGRLSRVSSSPFNGAIDQFRIFNRELTTSEVTTLYNETSASSTKSTTDIFDDSSGVALYELEGNANDTGGASGKFGSGAIFNVANSKITTPITTNYSNLSLSCWVKFIALPSGGADATLFYKGFYVSGSNNQYIHLRYEDYTDQFKFGVRQNGTYNQQAASGVTASLNTWYHVVGTLDSSGNAQIYVNGSAGTGITSAPTMTNSNNMEVGKSNSSINGYLILDDARIYSDVLTSTEVGYIYNNTTASIPTDNLEAYYKLDGDATDEQGNNDATSSNVTYAYNGTATNVSYAYDGTPTNVGFVGTSFQPDLVWIKGRTADPVQGSANHSLFDSVRFGNGGYVLYSNQNYAQATSTYQGAVTQYNSNGFSLGAGTNSSFPYFDVNRTGINYVAWCWKSGGTAVSNTDGTIASSVSANQNAGFSIVKYTTPTTNNFSVGHGLSSAPELVFFKGLNQADNWITYASPIAATKYLRLNASDAASTSSSPFNDTIPTSTVINLGSATAFWGTSIDTIAYCFHSVTGYQKVGSYSGTGSAGNAVTTGFTPRFILAKKITTDSSYNHWMILDSVRSSSGSLDDFLFANLSNSESAQSTNAGVTLQSDGFTPYGGMNNTVEYIYLAIK